MKAIEFLRAMYPNGPWVITAINPEQGKDDARTETETFGPNTEDKARAFLDRHMGNWNLYFTVNPVARPMRKKPGRTDIKSLSYLHVDVDPRYGEPLADEHKRIEALFFSNLPQGIPKPTVLLFSGGGYQAFWKLTEPLPLDGSIESAEAAKLYNLQLERMFQADSCHNIDRIMRLPGTINVPGAKKLKAGRVKVEAVVTDVDWTRSYSLSEFTAAPKVQTPDSGLTGQASGGIEVNISGNVERLTDVYDLDKYLAAGVVMPDNIRRIIQLGFDPDDTDGKRHDDRSVWVFHAVCALVRLGIPDEVIFSVLTDKDFRISDHVYDQKVGAEKYAIRQIQRAKEAAIDPQLEAINREYAVVNYEGKVRVMYESTVMIDDSPYTQLVTMTFEDFSKLYSNRFVVIPAQAEGDEPKAKPLGKWWLDHPNRKQYLRGVHFTPLLDQADKYNMWQGFATAPVAGKNHEPYLEHLRKNVCSGNQEYYEYLIRWMADAIQRPDRPGQVAVVLRGAAGAGKSFVATHFGKLFGRHFLAISNSKHLVGNFNAHLWDKIFLFADEAFFHGDKSNLSVLKTLITERSRMTEKKGFDAQLTPNYTRLMMASNDEQVVNAQAHERRFFALTVSTAELQNTEYFGAIAASLEDGGYQSLLHMLMTMDLRGWDIRKVPQTEELQTQKNMSWAPHQEWWYQVLLDGKVHGSHDGWLTVCPKDEVFRGYSVYMNQLKASRTANKTQLLRHLQEYFPKLEVSQRWVKAIVQADPYGPDWAVDRVERGKHMCYIFPELKECRRLFEEKHGPQNWGQSDSSLQLDDQGNSD